MRLIPELKFKIYEDLDQFPTKLMQCQIKAQFMQDQTLDSNLYYSHIHNTS